MYKGFTKATLGLLGAALLSSSAFAAGPTLSNLPNVIITQNDTFGNVDPGTGPTPATGIYLYTDAFPLTDYVTFDGDGDLDVDADDWNNVEWLFQEFDATGTTVQQTIKIGADLATAQLGATGTVDYAAVATSSQPSVQATGDLDFINDALTPDTTVSGTDPTGTFDTYTQTDTALIDLYVASPLVSGSTDVKSFYVYTTADNTLSPVDALTFTSGIYTPEACYDDFAGWFTNNTSSPLPAGVTQTPAPSVDADSAISATPTLQVTASTSTLAAFSPAASTPGLVGWSSFDRAHDATSPNVGTNWVDVAADDTLIMARWTVSADLATQTAAGSTPLAASVGASGLRVRIGELASLSGNGQSTDQWIPGSSNHITGASEVIRTYHYVKEGGNYDTPDGQPASVIDPGPNTNNPWIQDDDAPVRVGFAFDMIDAVGAVQPASFNNPARDYGWSLEKLEVFSAARSDLGSGNILLNQGEPTFTVADGTTPPPSSVGYDLTHWDFREEAGGSNPRITATPNEVDNTDTNYTAGPLTFTIAADTGSTDDNYIGIWDMRDFVFVSDPGEGTVGNLKSLEEAITVDNDTLIAIDAWVSSSAPGEIKPGVQTGFNAANSPVIVTDSGLSDIQVGYQTDFIGGTGPALATTVPGPLNPTTDLPPLPPGLTIAAWTQGRAGSFGFSASTLNAADQSDLLEPVYALETGAKRVTFFFEPNALGDDDTTDSISFRPWMRTISFGSSELLSMTADIRVHRVVVTEYPLPVDPDPNC
jgi:hypothetical protein